MLKPAMPDLTPYRRLALAVLEAAVRDAHRGRPDAAAFLANGNPLLVHWCRLLGIPPRTARRLLREKSWQGKLREARAMLAEAVRPPPPSTPPAGAAG